MGNKRHVSESRSSHISIRVFHSKALHQDRRRIPATPSTVNLSKEMGWFCSPETVTPTCLRHLREAARRSVPIARFGFTRWGALAVRGRFCGNRNTLKPAVQTSVVGVISITDDGVDCFPLLSNSTSMTLLIGLCGASAMHVPVNETLL